jgi:trehalose synthase
MSPVGLDAYRPLVAPGALELVRALARDVRGHTVAHVSASRYGSGPPEVLRILNPALMAAGVRVRWEAFTAEPRLAETAGRIQHALDGGPDVDDELVQTYAAQLRRVGPGVRLDADLVVLHDVAPLDLAAGGARLDWLWWSHHGVRAPAPRAREFLRERVERFAGVIHSPRAVADNLLVPQYLVRTALDPLGPRNRELSRAAIEERVRGLGVPLDGPLLLQIAPFEAYSRPEDLVEAHRLVRPYRECRLVVVGTSEAPPVPEPIAAAAATDPQVQLLRLPAAAELELNALERAADAVLQIGIADVGDRPLIEASWKRRPVVATSAPTTVEHIVDGVTGHIVHSAEGAAFRIRELLSDTERADAMGLAGHEQARHHHLVVGQLRTFLSLMSVLHPRDVN